MELQSVKGMKDILPREVSRWQRLEAAFRAVAELQGYAEVRTPILEPTALFARQIGETSDVVEKEMYSFERHGDQLTVRPEGTASAARAYVQHKVHATEAVSRWYYLGPMFRGERPAKGRYRQFYQAGCELYGDPGPLADAEMIDLVAGFLTKLGITKFKVHVNSLGSGETRARFKAALLAYFTPMKDKLSEDSQRRLEKNPLRILDSKDPRDREAAAGAPGIDELLIDDDKRHFEGLLHDLGVLGVPFEVDPSLVRGLDYYTRTLFEVRATESELGAQNTLVGGGRYDKMIHELGGPDTPAIGFAMGLERILELMQDVELSGRPVCYLAPLTEKGADKALLLARDLRALGVVSEIDKGGKLNRILARAEKRGARLCVILGDEVESGEATVKELAIRTQEKLPLEGLGRVLADRLAMVAQGVLPNDARGAR